MNIIRNAGFESGNLDYWDHSGDGILTCDAVTPKYGSYCGKLALGGFEEGYAINRDYIEVNGGEGVYTSVWIKGSGAGFGHIRVCQYDADLVEIESGNYGSISLSATYTRLRCSVQMHPETKYVRVGATGITAVASSDVRIDGMSVRVIDGSFVGILVGDIATLTNLTASGDTSLVNFQLCGGKEYYAEIDVTSITGTNPTCDVTICEEDHHGNERVLGTFTQFNAITDQRVGIAPPIGGGMYVKYVMGGTVTDCDFKVSVIGMR